MPLLSRYLSVKQSTLKSHVVCKAGFREERWEAKGNNLLSTVKQKFAGSENNPRMQERVRGNWGEGWSWAVWSQC